MIYVDFSKLNAALCSFNDYSGSYLQEKIKIVVINDI